MKLRRATVEPTDDGKFVVRCEAENDDGSWSEKDKTYVASSFGNIGAQLKKGVADIEATKAKKKKSGGATAKSRFM